MLVLGVAAVGPASKYSARPSSSQSGRSPSRHVQQGVRRLVAEVFLEPVAQVRVDDPAVPLGQEEGPARGEFGIVELEEVGEASAVVEDVDLDGLLVGPGAEAEPGLEVALERLQAADRRRNRRRSGVFE